MEHIKLTNAWVMDRVMFLVANWAVPKNPKIYGVPRGGVPVAYLFAPACEGTIVDDPAEADVIVDDIIDTGRTSKRYILEYQKPFYSLIDKQSDGDIEPAGWYVFPWEGDTTGSAEDIPTRLLQYLGENPERDGLLDTPQRYLKAWGELCAGYAMDPKEILSKSFENDKEYDQLVLLRDVEVCSVCEHHLLPFIGRAHVAYLPSSDGRVVGISKLARLVECFARRLQVQERLTQQIADALEECLEPIGVAVVVECQHLCMRARGVRERDSVMLTSAMRGRFRESASARTEFLALCRASSPTGW